MPAADQAEHLPPSKVILEYMREVRALGALKHENIVLMHGVLMRPRLCVALEAMDPKNLYQHMCADSWQVCAVAARLTLINRCFVFLRRGQPVFCSGLKYFMVWQRRWRLCIRTSMSTEI